MEILIHLGQIIWVQFLGIVIAEHHLKKRFVIPPFGSCFNGTFHHSTVDISTRNLTVMLSCSRLFGSPGLGRLSFLPNVGSPKKQWCCSLQKCGSSIHQKCLEISSFSTSWTCHCVTQSHNFHKQCLPIFPGEHLHTLSHSYPFVPSANIFCAGKLVTPHVVCF